MQRVITPTSGKKLAITRMFVSTEATTVDVTLEGSESSGVIFKIYTVKKQSQAGIPCNHQLAIDETLKLTCGAKTFVCIMYREID